MDFILLLVALVALGRIIIVSVIAIEKIKFKSLEHLGETITNAHMSCN